MCEPNVTGRVELADPKNHTIEPKITSLSYITEVMANFLVKFPIFRYHDNRGRLSEQSLTDTTKLADRENPLVVARIWGVSPAQAEL